MTVLKADACELGRAEFQHAGVAHKVFGEIGVGGPDFDLILINEIVPETDAPTLRETQDKLGIETGLFFSSSTFAPWLSYLSPSKTRYRYSLWSEIYRYESIRYFNVRSPPIMEVIPRIA